MGKHDNSRVRSRSRSTSNVCGNNPTENSSRIHTENLLPRPSRRRRSSSDSSSSSSSPERRTRKKKRHSSSGSDSSSSSTSTSPVPKKRSHKKSKKKKSKKEKKKLKKKLRKVKKILKKEAETSKNVPKSDSKKDSSKPKKPDEMDRLLSDRAKAMAPMTKEEWEKRQSVIRRVYDEETGRHRLIKGDGEVLEEIVSRERHKEINRQATRGDGAFFQAIISSKVKN